eukprot:jgi/Mesen1/9156/ME000059S08573
MTPLSSTPAVPDSPSLPDAPPASFTPIEPRTPSSPGAPPVPGTPSLPDVPNIPSSPVLPSAPGAPVVPGSPVTPKAPTVPSIPGALSVPGSPASPLAPGTPSAPEAPGVPGSPPLPGTPALPAVPGSPLSPATPIPSAEPGTPVPGTPASPSASAPGSPGGPSVPPVPTLPGSPSTPSVPSSTPSIPGTPDPSATPGQPGSPDAPSTPAVPTTPATPSTPTSPTDAASPASPTTPAAPASPSSPMTPTAPASPASPATPATPASPATPTSPATPASPASPASPATPASPADAGTPGSPGVPSKISAPASPGSPAGTPGSPAAPFSYAGIVNTPSLLELDVSFASALGDLPITNTKDFTPRWRLTGNTALSRCSVGCLFTCKLDLESEKRCGSGNVDEWQQSTYSGLADGHHSFLLTVSQVTGDKVGVHLTNFSVDTSPPVAHISPRTPTQVVELNGTQVRINTWTNASAIPFSLCISKPLKTSISSSYLQLTDGAEVVTFRADPTLGCPVAEDKAINIVSADSVSQSSAGQVSKVAVSDKAIVVDGGATSYLFEIRPPSSLKTGVIKAGVKALSFPDYAGNLNVQLDESDANIFYDVSVPTPVFVMLSDGKPMTTAPTYSFAVNFQEQVFGFGPAKMSLKNAAVVGFVVLAKGAVYGVDISINPKSVAEVFIPAGAVTDFGDATNKGTQAAATGVMAFAGAFVGAALIVPSMCTGAAPPSSMHVHSSIHALKSITRVQSFALTSKTQVVFPPNYESAASSGGFANFDIKMPFESMLFGSKRTAASAPGGQSFAPMPAGAPVGAPLAAASRAASQDPGGSNEVLGVGKAAAAGGASSAAGPSGSSDGDSEPSSPGTANVTAAAPAPGPAPALDCEGGVGLQADGSCSTLQTLANSQYAAFLTTDGYADFADSQLQDNLADPGANGLRKVSRVLFWLGCLMAAVCALQYLWPRVESRLGVALPDLLVYPRFQVFFVSVSLAAVVSLSAALLRGGTSAGIGIAVPLIVIYAFFLAWSCWAIWKTTIKESAARFVVVETKDHRLKMAKHVVGNKYVEAYWAAGSEDVLTRYGLLFEDVKGYKHAASKNVSVNLAPPSESQSDLVGRLREREWDREHFGVYDPPHQILAPVTEPRLIEQAPRYQYLSLVRQLFFAIDIACQVWLALLMGGFSEDSAAPQLSWVIGLRVIEVFILMLLKPMIGPGDFIVAVYSKLCDLGTAACSKLLLRDGLSGGATVRLGWALLFFQLTAILVTVGWFWIGMLRDLVLPTLQNLFTKKQRAATSMKAGVII